MTPISSRGPRAGGGASRQVGADAEERLSRRPWPCRAPSARCCGAWRRRSPRPSPPQRRRNRCPRCHADRPRATPHRRVDGRGSPQAGSRPPRAGGPLPDRGRSRAPRSRPQSPGSPPPPWRSTAATAATGSPTNRTEQMARVLLVAAPPDGVAVLASQHRVDARHLPGPPGIDARDAGVGVRAAEHPCVRHPRQLDVAGIPRRAADPLDRIDSRSTLAHHAHRILIRRPLGRPVQAHRGMVRRKPLRDAWRLTRGHATRTTRRGCTDPRDDQRARGSSGAAAPLGPYARAMARMLSMMSPFPSWHANS